MNLELYLLAGSIAALITYLTIFYLLKELKNFSAKKNKIQSMDRWGDSDKSHLGGISFFICSCFVFIYVLSQNITEIRGITLEFKLFVSIFAVILISVVVGLIDEKEILGPLSKIFFQIIICGVILWGGTIIIISDYFFINVIFTVLWILFFINAVGLFDNIDLGLTAFSIALLISLFIIGYINMASYMILLIISTYIGALIMFSYFNAYPSKIFMGEIGSLQIGSLLSLLSIQLIWNDLSTLSILDLIYNLLVLNIFNSIIFFDVMFVFYFRWLNSKPILKGDTTHLSHRFISLGFPPNIFGIAVLFVNLIAFLIYYNAQINSHISAQATTITVFLFYIFLLILFCLFFGYKIRDKADV